MHSRWSAWPLPWGALLVVAAVLGAAGCSENPVGRRCFIGADAGNESQAIVSSRALECPSRLCLHYPQDNAAEPPEGAEYADMCTGQCEADDECDKVPESPCVSGFTCAIPVVVGPFCCQKMCICKDFLIVPEGGFETPEACNPDLPENTCINI